MRRRPLGLFLAGILALLAAPALGGDGDVDQSGSLDAADVLRLNQGLRGERTLTPAEEAAADVAPVTSGSSGGNGVDAADLGVLIRALAGEDFDGDGLAIRAEQQARTSPFSADSDGDGTPDAEQDSDGDGLSNADEQALGSNAGEPSGVGSADVDFEPDVPDPAYRELPDGPYGQGPKVLFYASRPSAYLTPDPVTGKTRMDPLKDLLREDGYEVADFTNAPLADQYDTYKDFLSCGFVGSPPCDPNRFEYESDIECDVFVIVEPSEPISPAEGATLRMFLGLWGASILVLSENGTNVAAAGGASFVGTRVTHDPMRCPTGASGCPSGWGSFRSSDGSLDTTHAVITGRYSAEILSSVTSFFGAAVDTPTPRYVPDTRHLADYRELLRLGSGATAVVGATPVAANGWAQGVAIEIPPELCTEQPRRSFWSADVEMMTALREEGSERGMNAVGSESNQQLTLNLFHWLDGLTAAPSVPIWEQVFAQESCRAGQAKDRFYMPLVATPAATGSLVLVDSSHNNASTLEGRLEGFGKLLEADGYQVEDSPDPLDTPELLDGAEILVVANPQEAISESEALTVDAWVRNGGTLLLVVDHHPHPSQVSALASRLGIAFQYPSVRNFTVVPPSCLPSTTCEFFNIVFARTPLNTAEGRIEAHPVRDGTGTSSDDVSFVRAYTGSAFIVDTPQSLATYSPTLVYPDTAHTPTGDPVGGYLLGLAIELEDGRVYVSGENAMLTAQIQGETAVTDANGNPVLDSNNDPVEAGIGEMGINAEPGNEQYLLNIVHWLDGLL